MNEWRSALEQRLSLMDDAEPSFEGANDDDADGITMEGPLPMDLEGTDRSRRDLEDDDEEREGNAKKEGEITLLRLENSLLRKKVKELERVQRGEKWSTKFVVDESEMARIDLLLKRAEDAKTEAMTYVANTSREKLSQDVKVLQSILKKAKAERHAFKKKIKAVEDRLLLEREKIEKEEIRFQVDREIFAKILQDDRDSYKHEVNLLVQKMTELQKEKHALYLWAKEQQERHLQEIRKLTRALGRTKKLVEEQVR
ncbi:hypothetical protein Poli38472_002266 [Pythium oligandrum]|uniref:Uncharacterized protein n=1 Tax=Pythium oligandrum TaxID=41045 RepID=A0A8K1CHH9_PYTOL|nr:hypothetical protein Poli38472_002266 [Pythium oligandrum]|eukprot:TMW63325.1 hypothetical protein Poli38472_002266 [Pythium oligandrum]